MHSGILVSQEKEGNPAIFSKDGPGGTVLRNVGHMEKDKHCMVSYRWNLKKSNL